MSEQPTRAGWGPVTVACRTTGAPRFELVTAGFLDRDELAARDWAVRAGALWAALAARPECVGWTMLERPRPSGGRASLRIERRPGDPTHGLDGSLRLVAPRPDRWPAEATAAGRLAAALGPARAPRVVAVSEPRRAVLLAAIPAAVRWFDAIDDWGALPGFGGPATDRGYAAVRRHADIVTATTARLCARIGHPSALALGNAAHPALAGPGSGRPEWTGPPLPLPPFAVYVGVRSERVDVALLAAVARAGLAVAVAGWALPGTGEALPAGVVDLGPVGPEQLRALLAAAALGLVAHRVDPLTTTQDPLKVYDYLAAGLPVLATRIPVDPAVAAHVHRVAPSGWPGAARALVAAPRPGLPSGGVPRWADRADQAMAHLEPALWRAR